MALRDQPYFPLYADDYLTDEKLNLCSAASQGVFIKILCVMHKQNEYGTILLKQKDKQNPSTILNFACKLAKLLPFDQDTIHGALEELIEEGVLHIEGDKIFQKRMVKDGEISLKRSQAGKDGGGNPNLFKQTDKQKGKQKGKQNPVYEYEHEDGNEDINVIEDIGEDVEKIFIKRWSRNYKNISELQGAEKLVLEFGIDKVSEAFKIAGERDKTSIAYVRGILNNHTEQKVYVPKIKSEFQRIVESEIEANRAKNGTS